MKTIIQGEREIFKLKLVTREKGSDVTENIDLSSVLSASSKVCFKAGTTKVEKLFSGAEVSITDAAKGELEATLLATDSDLFSANDVGAVEIVLDFGSGDIQKIQIANAFQIIAKICD